MTEKKKLLEELKKIDIEFVDYLEDLTIDNESINEIEKFSISNFTPEKKAVLGLDIYKYSSFDTERQNLVPFVFDIIKDEAIKYAKHSEKTLFPASYENKFISTGDGGFMIFETPLHALLFNLSFYSALHLFNTGHFFPKISQYIGELVIRSTLTYDDIYLYEKNYYGKAIITNSRILSKDKLNRFLIDKNTYNFFVRHFNGIETLPILTKSSLKRVLNIEEEIDSYFIYKDDLPKNLVYISDRIRNVHIQKIEDLFEKETQLTIYNVEIQIATEIRDEIDPEKTTRFILSIGNSNTIR